MASKVVKQLAGNGTGQSLVDRMSAAKYSLAGSGLGRGVIKATTEEISPPKKKHLDYLTNCTNEVNVSIPELAEYLIDRTQQASWVVVLKTFITTHHLMNFGNEKFSQYLAAKNTSLSLPNFVDKTSSIGYEMSQYVKPYSKYINEKSSTYRLMAFDFCKIKRGRDDGILRRMPSEKLMKTLPILQGQIDILLEFDATQKDLVNPVLNAAFTLLYKDLIRLYASYNEGMINLIELYFSMNHKSCKESLDMYKAFLERTEKVTKFVTVAEGAGVGDKASLGLQAVPPKVLETLENHLANLEKNKTSLDSDEVKAPASTPASLTIKINKPETTQYTKKSNQSTPPHPPKPEAPKVQESNTSHEPQNNISGNVLSSDKTAEVAVRTQLRRPEQQHSVAVTVKRPGRSPSPARPPRPTQNRSRDVSPAKNEPHAKENNDEDFFSHLRDESSANLEITPTTPVNGRASPFSADEKPLESPPSFWNSNISSNEPDKQVGNVDFESAFNESSLEGSKQNHNEMNLFETDLLGLDICDDSTNKPITPVESKNSAYADLDDIFALGSCESSILTDAPLAPSAVSPMASRGFNDDVMTSFTTISPSYSSNNSISNTSTLTNVTSTRQASTILPTNKPSKPSDAAFNDTLADLAQSLGKRETKWSSPKPQTLAGKSRDNVGISTGPTINWAANTTAAGNNGNTTSISSSNNNNDNLFADLLG